MDVKRPLLHEEILYVGRTHQKHQRWARIVQMSCLLVLLAPLYMTTHTIAWRLLPGRCHVSDRASATFSYPGENIDWTPCGTVANRTVECSNITVPMDQFNPVNGYKTFTIPLIRRRGNNATQNLLLNPGGPGGSGVDFLYRKGEQLSTIVGEGFHLLSFDPRGIGNSTPKATCYPDQETRRRLSGHRASKIIEDSPEAYAFATNFVKGCADTMGEHGKYIDTPQTAADMNSILNAVGQRDMIYWGFSYGTLLGQTYAGLFPERSHRVIIDGVVNQFDWYQELASPEDFSDTTNVFQGFAEECIKAGTNCSLAAHGKTAKELMTKIIDFAETIGEEPLPVYVNTTAYGLLDYNTVMYSGVFPTLYRPAGWYELADRLAKLLDGNGTAAYLAYGGDAFAGLSWDGNTFVTMNDQATGPENWPQDRLDLLDLTLPVVNQSLFGPAWAETYYTKQKWALEQTRYYDPKYNVETLHPLLILSTTYDPVCPLVSARSAKKAFKDSEIVELQGYGHCSLAMPSTCIAKHVRDFLYNGTVPEDYTQCKADGPYFIKPDDDGEAPKAHRNFDNEDEMRIHMAQVALANDAALPMWLR